MEHKSHMQSSEDYLKALFLLQRKTPYIRPTDLAIQMGYTKPSVSRALSILKKDGYVEVDGEGAITLTSKGLAIAETMYTRHTVLTEMLKGLGVDEKTAAEDACRIEHVISEKSFAAMQAHLNQTKISDVESSGAQD